MHNHCAYGMQANVLVLLLLLLLELMISGVSVAGGKGGGPPVRVHCCTQFGGTETDRGAVQHTSLGAPSTGMRMGQEPEFGLQYTHGCVLLIHSHIQVVWLHVQHCGQFLSRMGLPRLADVSLYGLECSCLHVATAAAINAMWMLLPNKSERLSRCSN